MTLLACVLLWLTYILKQSVNSFRPLLTSTRCTHYSDHRPPSGLEDQREIFWGRWWSEGGTGIKHNWSGEGETRVQKQTQTLQCVRELWVITWKQHRHYKEDVQCFIAQSVQTTRRWLFSRWMWIQLSSVSLCTCIILNSAVQNEVTISKRHVLRSRSEGL